MIRNLVLTSFAVTAAAVAWPQGAKLKLAAPFATPSVNNGPRVISRPDGAQLRVPAGFHVDEFASGFQRPRIMIYAPRGEILITDPIANGAVSVLTDRTGKAVADRRKLIEGLDRPY